MRDQNLIWWEGELELERVGIENYFKEGCYKEDQRNRVTLSWSHSFLVTEAGFHQACLTPILGLFKTIIWMVSVFFFFLEKIIKNTCWMNEEMQDWMTRSSKRRGTRAFPCLLPYPWYLGRTGTRSMLKREMQGNRESEGPSLPQRKVLGLCSALTSSSPWCPLDVKRFLFSATRTEIMRIKVTASLPTRKGRKRKNLQQNPSCCKPQYQGSYIYYSTRDPNLHAITHALITPRIIHFFYVSLKYFNK